MTIEEFNGIITDSKVPVIVDFWAPWCGPCQAFSPILAEFEAENEGKIAVVKVNVDEEPEIAIKYKVASIPTIIVFKNGEAYQKRIGLQTKEVLSEMIQ